MNLFELLQKCSEFFCNVFHANNIVDPIVYFWVKNNLPTMNTMVMNCN